MENDQNEKIVYSINVKDIQTVAQEEIERNLNLDEITKIEDTIAENIDWYGAIVDAINSNLDIEQTQSLWTSK
ncbi:MAG: hypothetical protein QQN41_11605 [Nitrosopumilus sp.]